MCVMMILKEVHLSHKNFSQWWSVVFGLIYSILPCDGDDTLQLLVSALRHPSPNLENSSLLCIWVGVRLIRFDSPPQGRFQTF